MKFALTIKPPQRKVNMLYGLVVVFIFTIVHRPTGALTWGLLLHCPKQKLIFANLANFSV